MSEHIIASKPAGFQEPFALKPGANKHSTHYCPGCGHGVLHKLIAEAIVDLDMQEKMIFLCPVGCAVFAYYYFDTNSISVPHGRAPAVATGLLRANPDSHVINYQGDGDLGAIGLNNLLQAANRGEQMLVCFVNNATYGMTGGQMAPTSLPGQVTLTCPEGRDVTNEGWPLKICEMVSALDAPIYVERVALTDAKHVARARKALRKGLTYTKEKRGFVLLEFLSACPVNMKKSAVDTNAWIHEAMTEYFPLQCFKDIGESREPIKRPTPIMDAAETEAILYPTVVESKQLKKTKLFAELRIKCAGVGGQGILSLGMMIANMAHSRKINASWLPSYGPEMRGGYANCSIVLSRHGVSDPIVKEMNILVAMNQMSVDRFLPDVYPGGMVLYDSTNATITPEQAEGYIVYQVPATETAQELGNAKYANAVILGAFSRVLSGLVKETYEETFIHAVEAHFGNSPERLAKNLEAFEAGKNRVVI